jgi:hypothetical protein
MEPIAEMYLRTGFEQHDEHFLPDDIYCFQKSVSVADERRSASQGGPGSRS